MRVFDINKQTELTEYDLEHGYLKDDVLTVRVPATDAKEEIYHYVTVAKYPSGGMDVEKVIDSPAVDGASEHDETEDIMVYVPYTEDEMVSMRAAAKSAELKAELVKVKEDIEQQSFGLVRDDYPQKRARAAAIINALRVLEGKPPRDIENI